MSSRLTISNHSEAVAAPANDTMLMPAQTSNEMIAEKGISLAIQCKLSIGAVDDPLEDEADSMADKVMRMPEPNAIQRKCAHCEEEEKAQLKPTDSFIQKKQIPDNIIQREEKSELQIEESFKPKPGSADPDYLSLKTPFIERNALHLWDADAALGVWRYNFRFFKMTGLSDNLAGKAANLSAPFAIDSQLKAGNPKLWELSDKALNTTSITGSVPLFNFDANFKNWKLLPFLQKKELDNPSPVYNAGGNENFIQRKCAHCEEEEKAQQKPLAPFIQTKSSNNNNVVASDRVSGQIQSTKDGGNPMSASAKSFMESRFGADFSHVRIHADSNAAKLSNDLNAQAFTVGNNVYFNEGKYAPETESGKHLLAHELTHTIQQSESNNISLQEIQKQSTSGTSTPPATNGGLTNEMLAQIARRLRNAMKGWGTDEDAIYGALSGRTQAQVDTIAATYQTLFNRILIADLQDELNDGEMRHLANLSPALVTDKGGTPAEQAQSFADVVAQQLYNAMEGWGTDESAIFSSLTGRTQDELLQIGQAYQRLTKHTLEADLRDELSGSDLTHAIRLLNQGVLQPEDELYLAMEGLGTDEDTVFRVLDALAGNTTAIQNMEAAYRSKYGDLIADLRGDLSSREYARAMRVLGSVLQDAAFEDCAPNVINEVRALIPTGIQKVEHAIAVLSKGLAGMSAPELTQFKRFFDPANTGDIDQRFVSDVLVNFKKIRQEFRDDLTVECESGGGICNGGRLYYTYWSNVHVCPYFTTETDTTRKARDFVHELAHNAMLAVDRPYYSPGSTDYAGLTPRGPLAAQIPVVGYLIRFISRSDTLYHPDAYSWFAFEVP